MPESLQPTLDTPGSVSNTLAMPQLFAIGGEYPSRTGQAPCLFTEAMVQGFAGSMAAFDAPRSEGQLLPVMTNQGLYALLGTSFGGDGMRTVGIPNLNNRAVVGGSEGNFGNGTLSMQYLIAAQPGGAAPPVGTVIPFGGNFAPDGWMIADGSLLAVSQHIPLFEAIGTNFGGNVAAFALPNLGGCAAIGVGQGAGLPPVALGQQVNGTVPGLGLNYLIAIQGVVPEGSGGAFPGNEPYLGQVIAFAGAQVPAGWAPCDGSLFEVAANQQLFQLIGTTYGGDGKVTFALPDLRGRMLVGLGG